MSADQNSWQAHISNSGGIRVVFHYSDWDQNRSEKGETDCKKIYMKLMHILYILTNDMRSKYCYLWFVFTYSSRYETRIKYFILLTFFWSALKTIRVELGNDPCNTARLRVCFEKEYGVRTHSEKNVQKDCLGSSPLHCQKDGTKTIICHYKEWEKIDKLQMS